MQEISSTSWGSSELYLVFEGVLDRCEGTWRNLGQVWVHCEACCLFLHLLHGLDVDVADLLLDQGLPVRGPVLLRLPCATLAEHRSSVVMMVT